MTEDIYEPLARYRDEFKEKFARLVRDKFAALTAESGIDIEANRRKVAEIKAACATADSEKTKRIFAGIAAVVALCGAIGGFAYAYNFAPSESMYWGVGSCALSLVILIFSVCAYLKISKKIAEIEAVIERKKKEAFKQMQPLNSLYTWDIPVGLIESTVPRLEFDPFFAAARLEELKRSFGWDDEFNEGKSICFAQSGEINGNPFVFGDSLEMQWGTKSYTGYKTISWTERETGADGKSHSVTKYETLSATIEKPIPVYANCKFLIYGNDAAPNLSFSREPSGLSGADGDLFTSIRKKWKISRLKAHSRNLDDESQFTMMSNHDFEALFSAKDRDNEVEFRLLFTALAQTQMLQLLNDKKVGYGDDFHFIKAKKINMIIPKHLAEGILDTSPEHFYGWDYDAARDNFYAFNEKYFKDVYFALAPLLAIPLYQQTRTHENIYKGVIDAPSSFWEHEAIANYYGEDKFKSADCITQNILKTRMVSREGGAWNLEVTAYGYRGEKRVESRTVWGGDGRAHNVDVDWTEYLPVSKTTPMLVSEGRRDESRADSPSELLRRSIYSYLPKI